MAGLLLALSWVIHDSLKIELSGDAKPEQRDTIDRGLSLRLISNPLGMDLRDV